MSKNFVQPGNVLDYTAAATLAAGAVVIMGVRVGVVLQAMVSGDVGAVQVTGVFNLAKLSTDVIAQGALVYWDNTNSRITTTSAGNTLAGYAAKASGSGVATCDVSLNA